MRPSDIPDELIASVAAEFKQRRGLQLDLEPTTMIKDILIDWRDHKCAIKPKKVNMK